MLDGKHGIRITLLAGGVGGAKMAEGLVASRFGDGLTIIGNIGDDHEFHGLWVSPDIDTLIYTLADQVDRDQGWGIAGDSFRTLETLAALGTETWMRLGDQDFATHILRTQMQRQNKRPTETIATIASRWGVTTPIRLPSDDLVRTQVQTDGGWLNFQEYFVRERCHPTVQGVDYTGAQDAQPTPEALAAIDDAELIVIAPSNPIVSIGPILAIPGLAAALCASPAQKVAVSPLIGGRPVKGPADRMLQAMDLAADPAGLADYYGDLIDALVIDHADADFAASLRRRGLYVVTDDILMRDHTDKRRLAESVVTQSLTRTDSPCR